IREKFLADVLHKRPDSIRNSATPSFGTARPTVPCWPFAEALLTEESVRACPEMVLQDLLLVALREGCYDARARYLLKHVAFAMRITGPRWREWELKTCRAVERSASEAEVVDEAMKRNRRRKVNRVFLIGASAVGGGLLIGLTGGLAAPLGPPAPASSSAGRAAAAPSGTVAGAAVLGSVFGVAGAGLTGWKMRKRVGSLARSSSFCTCASQCRAGLIRRPGLPAALAVPGYEPEQYALCWESRYLKEMGRRNAEADGAVRPASGDHLASRGSVRLLQRNRQPLSVCGNRAVEGGKVLADVLLSREYGQRPVTLIGFSMGAKLIFSCLQELAECEGIIEDVLPAGRPRVGSAKDWSPFARVVSGKIFMYRTMSASFSLAARTSPVVGQAHVQPGPHSMIAVTKDYFKKMSEILPIIGVRLPTSPSPSQPPAHHLGAASFASARPLMFSLQLLLWSRVRDQRLRTAGAAAPAKSDKPGPLGQFCPAWTRPRRRLLAEEAGGVPAAARGAFSRTGQLRLRLRVRITATRIGAVKAYLNG
uniref:DUF726-domain-containing protein n=1 Tax=Macrostomum lignano TaxID=282301 RepID=A0A1I8FK00_9PLAT